MINGVLIVRLQLHMGEVRDEFVGGNIRIPLSSASRLGWLENLCQKQADYVRAGNLHWAGSVDADGDGI